nr:acetyltransferase [Vibrio cholerae]
MVAVVMFEFGSMRCQPLRRALYVSEELWIKLNLLKSSKK